MPLLLCTHFTLVDIILYYGYFHIILQPYIYLQYSCENIMTLYSQIVKLCMIASIIRLRSKQIN